MHVDLEIMDRFEELECTIKHASSIPFSHKSGIDKEEVLELINNIKPETFIHAMEEYDIYVSTTTACSSLEESKVLNALSNGDKNVSTTSIRVSISHMTTMTEIHEFLDKFDKVWNDLLLK